MLSHREITDATVDQSNSANDVISLFIQTDLTAFYSYVLILTHKLKD